MRYERSKAGRIGLPAGDRGDTVVTKVAVGGLLGAFVLFYILTSPDQAANIVHAGWHALVKLAHGVGDFVDKVSS